MKKVKKKKKKENWVRDQLEIVKKEFLEAIEELHFSAQKDSTLDKIWRKKKNKTMKQDTLLTDDDGNKLYEGDTIEWSYIGHGTKTTTGFMQHTGGEDSQPMTRTETLVFKRFDNTQSGYRLSRPAEGWTASNITMKKINP